MKSVCWILGSVLLVFAVFYSLQRLDNDKAKLRILELSAAGEEKEQMIKTLQSKNEKLASEKSALDTRIKKLEADVEFRNERAEMFLDVLSGRHREIIELYTRLVKVLEINAAISAAQSKAYTGNDKEGLGVVIGIFDGWMQEQSGLLPQLKSDLAREEAEFAKGHYAILKEELK